MKKRFAVYGVISLMLCMATYLNWSYTNSMEDLTVTNEDLIGKNFGQVQEVSVDITSDYFAQARLTRQTARDEAINIIETSAYSESASDETKNQLAETIAQIATDTVTEARIETLIKAKGFEDAVVFLSNNDVSVIVSKLDEESADADVAKIKDIIITEASVTAKNIKISEAP